MVGPVPELRQLRYFLAVADNGGFTQAARQLGLTQPPLSLSIGALEKSLGVALFERSRSGVSLTPAGRALVTEAREIVRRAERIGSLSRSSQTVRIGAISSAISGRLPAIAQRLPFAIQVSELNQRDQRSALERGDIDIGICRSRAESRLTVVRLADERLFGVVPADHVVTGTADLDLAALADDPFVMFPREGAPEAFDSIIAACQRAGYSPRVVSHASNDQALLGMVACRLGVSIVPASSTTLQLPGVRFLPLRDPDAQTPLSLLATAPSPWLDVLARALSAPGVGFA